MDLLYVSLSHIGPTFPLGLNVSSKTKRTASVISLFTLLLPEGAPGQFVSFTVWPKEALLLLSKSGLKARNHGF